MASGVIEKLSNDSANGYCKFPDGTLICYGSNSVTTPSAGGKFGYFGSTSVTFPQTFSACPIVIPNVDKSPAFWSVNTQSTSTTGATIGVASDTQNGSANVTYIAVGRWK